MKRIPESLITDIRNKTDIVDFISQYLPLNRKGKNYWGVCPFHDDNDPSMSVAPDKQIYKCFVCNHGGNVFQFVQDYEKVSFVDSVIKVADFVNVDLSEYRIETVEHDPQLQKYYEIMNEAQTFLQYQLRSEEGIDAVNNLYERGYSDEVIDKFEVGFASSKVSLSNFLLAKSYSEQDLIDVNLSRNIDGQIRDVFFDRIMFPIHDRNGQVIAYSGRALAKESNIKYINTSNTALYTKGDVVYNYHRAKDSARYHQAIIVTEGVTDSFAFSIAGNDNVVSLLGVAGTDGQIKEVSYLSKTVILAFDGDQAGQSATYAIGKKFKNMRCDVYVWYNDSGMDPDDLLRKSGAKALNDGLENKIAWLDYIVFYAIGTYGLNSFENKKKVAKFVIDELQNEDTLAQDYYMKMIAEKTSLDLNILESFLNKKESREKSRRVFIENKKATGITATVPEQTILKQMLYSKDAAYRYRDKLGFLIDDVAQELGLVILDAYRIRDNIEIADLLSLDINQNIKDLLLHIESNTSPSEFDYHIFDENINIVKRRLEEMGIKQLQRQSIEQIDDKAKMKLLFQAIGKKKEGES